MNLRLPDLAADAGRSFREQIVRAGGVDMARAAEQDATRRDAAEAVVSALGVADLDVRGDEEHALTAGELCRVAGEYALPFPIVGETLALGGRRLAVADLHESESNIDHGDLGEWLAVGLDGRGGPVVVRRRVTGMLSPFVVVVALEGSACEVPLGDVALWLILDSWLALGAMQRAVATAAAHITERIQFGRPLSHFQALRFRIADRVAAVAAAQALIHFTTWNLFKDPKRALVDALAARTIVVETLRPTFRDCHLLYGALGFCDEVDLSILDRHIQPHTRLPWDYETTSRLLTTAIERDGLDTIFGRFGGPGAVGGDAGAPALAGSI